MRDNYDLWRDHDDAMEDELENLPVCSKCGHPIQQDVAVYYNHQWICEDCESDFWQDIREDLLASVMD